MIVLEKEKRLKIVREGIQRLESRALSERHLVPPNEQEIYLTHEQLMVESLRTAQSPVFDGKTLTQKNLEAKNQKLDLKQPSFLVYYEKELQNYEEKKQYRRKMSNKRVKENETTYFNPARKAIQLNKEAINLALLGENENAIDTFYQALKTFPDVIFGDFESANPGYLCILYNLGLILFNNGYFEEGLEFLTNYYAQTSEGDNFRDQLQEILQIQLKYEHRKRVYTVDYEEIHFEKHRKHIIHNISDDSSAHIIKLPFKQPVSLKIERKDKDKVRLKLLDYFYMNQIFPLNHEDAYYEIMLPLDKIPDFYDDFLQILDNKPSIQYWFAKEQTDFLNELMLADSRERTRKWHDEPEMERKLFKSVIFLKIPESLKDVFYEEYRLFVTKYVLTEHTDEELDELNLEDLKRSRDHYEHWFRGELEKEFRIEKEHHQRVANIYADLKVLEQNLIQNKPDPFKIHQDSVHKEFKKRYAKFIGDVLDYNDMTDFDKEDAPKQKNLASIPFHNEKLKIFVIENVETMQNLLDFDAYAALAKIRPILEEILTSIFDKKGYSFYKSDGNELTPTLMAENLYKQGEITNNIKEDIIELHSLSKSHSHFGNQNYEFWILTEQSRSYAEKKLEKLNEVISHLVTVFRL